MIFIKEVIMTTLKTMPNLGLLQNVFVKETKTQVVVEDPKLTKNPKTALSIDYCLATPSNISNFNSHSIQEKLKTLKFISLENSTNPEQAVINCTIHALRQAQFNGQTHYYTSK